MSVLPGGYSDPSNKTQYGSAAYPPGPATYIPGQPQQNLFLAQQQSQYGVPVSIQPVMPINLDPATLASFQAMQATFDPNNPANSEHPVQMKCPSCQAQITTTTTYVVTGMTYFWCIALCFMGFILCAWLPFVMNCATCKDVVHTCPSCKAECGRFNIQVQGRGYGRGHRHLGRHGRR